MTPDRLLDLTGRSAVVTGAATGIGEAIARTLAAAGASVTVADIDVVGARRVAGDIGGAMVELDVTDPVACAEVLGASGDRLDILINNAGSYHDAGSILDQTVESWQRAVDINLRSVFNCSKAAAERMVLQNDSGVDDETGAERGGTIVNIASVDGIVPCLGTGYDTAKAGVIHFTKSLAVDLAPHGIRVNAVSPGVVIVPTLDKMHSGEIEHFWPKEPSLSGLMGPITKQRSSNVPLGRTGRPDEIGSVVLFLVSDASSYVTGQNIAVDGGWTLI